MKQVAFIIALVAVIYFLTRKEKAAVLAAPPRIPKYVATGYQGTMDIVSIAASQPIIPVTNFLNFSETAD